jgi:hypothetical protein
VEPLPGTETKAPPRKTKVTHPKDERDSSDDREDEQRRDTDRKERAIALAQRKQQHKHDQDAADELHKRLDTLPVTTTCTTCYKEVREWFMTKHKQNTKPYCLRCMPDHLFGRRHSETTNKAENSLKTRGPMLDGNTMTPHWVDLLEHRVMQHFDDRLNPRDQGRRMTTTGGHRFFLSELLYTTWAKKLFLQTALPREAWSTGTPIYLSAISGYGEWDLRKQLTDQITNYKSMKS